VRRSARLRERVMQKTEVEQEMLEVERRSVGAQVIDDSDEGVWPPPADTCSRVGS
jgi:hypothetical protein